MVIKDCVLKDKEGTYDVICEGEYIKDIIPHDEKALYENKQVIDAKKKLLMPPFVEPHIHLDCVLTAGIPHYNRSGTLFEGISTWHEYKTTQPLVVSEIKDRAKTALRLMAEHGVQFVRTHVDVTESSFKGVQALEELKHEMAGIMEIQTVAFPQNGILSVRDGKKLMEKAMAMGMDCVGGIPHYEYTREYGVDSLKFIFELAEKYDAYIDVHCDEIDDEQSRYLETLATLAWERNYGEKTVAAHACAMGSYNDAYCTKLFRLLKDSKVNLNACPSANIHLQGRIDSYPKRRGVTRIKELSHEGINIALGQDSISDAWYTLGVGNLLRVLEMGIHVSQMTGYDDLKDCLRLISYNGARNLCLDREYGIEIGKKANFILLNGTNDLEIIRFLSPILLSVHNGRIIASKNVEEACIKF